MKRKPTHIAIFKFQSSQVEISCWLTIDSIPVILLTSLSHAVISALEWLIKFLSSVNLNKLEDKKVSDPILWALLLSQWVSLSKYLGNVCVAAHSIPIDWGVCWDIFVSFFHLDLKDGESGSVDNETLWLTGSWNKLESLVCPFTAAGYNWIWSEWHLDSKRYIWPAVSICDSIFILWTLLIN